MWSRKASPVATLTLPFPSRSTLARSFVSLLLRVTSAFLLKTHLDRVRVRTQSFHPGQPKGGLLQRVEVAAVKAQHAHLLHERPHAEWRREARSARGRERVVGTGRVITERNCGIGPDENRARILDLARPRGRVLGDYQEMLRRVFVRDFHRLAEVAHDDRAARRGTNDVRPLQAQQQIVELFLYPVGKC